MRFVTKLRFPVLATAGLLLAAVGAGLGLIAVFAGPLGLGIQMDFVLFRQFGWPRRETLYIGTAICTASAAALVFARLGFDDGAGWRRFAANSSLFVVSTFIALMLAELVVRAIDGIPLWPIENRLAKEQALLHTNTNSDYHPILGWVHKPNVRSGSGNSTFTTGEHGVRMHQAEITPLPAGAILAVGDSFTAGSEVSDSQSWPAHLEQILGESVLNAGAGGWGTDQIVLRAEEMIELVAPKAVIVSFFQDDIARAGERVHGSANKPWFSFENGRLVHHNKPVPKFTGLSEEIGAPLLGYSYLATWLMNRTGHGEWWSKINTSYVRAENDPDAVTCALLERLKTQTSEKGINLLLVLQYGGADHLPASRQKAKTVATARCAGALGIELIDLWEALVQVHAKGLPALKDLFVMHDEGRIYGHMSGEGNAFVARRIAGRLKAMLPAD